MDRKTTDRRYYTALVVGDDHQGIIGKYGHDNKVEPYVKYRYLEAEKYLKNIKKVISSLCDNWKVCGLSNDELRNLKERLSSFERMSPFEYYKMLTDGMHYDDEGNAITEDNPHEMFLTCSVGGSFSIPFTLIDGSESYSTRKGYVDWGKIHMGNTEIYQRAWEIVVEGKAPHTEEEKRIAASMGDKKNYFSNFSSMEEYVRYSTSFWTYAFVTKDGWHDVETDCNGDMNRWICEFYDRFIKNMADGEKLTIYECRCL